MCRLSTRWLVLGTLVTGLLIALGLATIGSAQAVNAPPAIIKLPDIEGAICPPGEGIAYTGSATVQDDSYPGTTLRTSWEQLAGPAIVTFSNRNSVATYICFRKAGVYDLRLFADDGEFVVSDDLRITVTVPVSP